MEVKTNSNFNKTATRQISKAYNPHSKKNQAAKEKAEEMKKNEEEILKEKMGEDLISQKEPQKLNTKELISKNLISQGYIESFIDFFYIGWMKTPSLISDYYKKENLEDSKDKADEDNEEGDTLEKNAEIKDEDIQRHNFEFKKLAEYNDLLISAEKSLREASKKEILAKNADTPEDSKKYWLSIEDEIQKAIKCYKTISDQTAKDTSGIPVEAIYFIEKRINLSKKYNLHGDWISALIDMGGCFEKIGTQKAMNTSKTLKEEARDVFENQYQGDNPDLKNTIYSELMLLYSLLAGKQEKMKCYLKAIDLLNAYLDVLKKLMEGESPNKPTYEEHMNKRTAIYLKIANLYYLLQEYDMTLKTLDNIEELKNFKNDKNLSVRNIIYIIYLGKSNSRALQV